MSYITQADLQNIQAIYKPNSLSSYSNFREKEVETEGLYGRLYYTTNYLPKDWTLETYADFNSQQLADYLLANTIDSDPRVSKAISDHFWEF